MQSPLSSSMPKPAFSPFLPLNNIQKEVKAQTSVPFISFYFFSPPAPLSPPFFLCLFFAVISCAPRLWLPDQATDGSGRRASGACPRGGSWPHSHMWCLRSLRLRSAWQWGKMRWDELPLKYAHKWLLKMTFGKPLRFISGLNLHWCGAN